MLTILTKKRYGFRSDDMNFETQGNSVIEEAPEWIAKTDLYKMAMADGSIIEVKTHASDPVVEAAASKSKKR